MFQNEQDLAFHKERVHEYRELCQLYPCEHCGFRSGNILELNNHIETEHRETLYGKRKKQNLGIDMEEESDDEIDKPLMISWPKYNVKDNGVADTACFIPCLLCGSVLMAWHVVFIVWLFEMAGRFENFEN